MIRFSIALTISMVIITGSQAQTSAPSVDMIRVGTVAPEVASLGKFGNIPVSPCTGVPGITIPVYTISVGKINLPISFDYHAGGIRIDETASCVGLGWALNANGMISRTMVGRPDEESVYGYINAPDAHTVYLSKDSYAEYLNNVHKNMADAEPDIFQYNINGQSGKFIFRHDGTVMQIPQTNNKILFSGSNFTITDENGNVYLFDEKQQTVSSETTMPIYYSQWRLTRMIAANMVDTIYFSYETSCNLSYEHHVNASFNLGVVGPSCNDGYPSFPVGQAETDYHETITHWESYLKQITWRGGKVEFVNACDRSDVTGTGMRLDEINVYNIRNGIYSQIKRVKLYQSYFFSNPPFPNPPAVTEKNYRLRLDSVGFLPVGSDEQPQVYSMTYDNTDMAPRESYIMDRWGFNNGKFSSGNYMPHQKAVYNKMVYEFGGADRSTDETYSKACTIKSIKYPTKGTSNFEFEQHRYKTEFSETQSHEVYCGAVGSVQSYSQTTFTVGQNTSDYTYHVFISRFNYSGPGEEPVTDRPRVILTDQTTNQQIFFEAQQPGHEGEDYNSGVAVLSLIPGHTYLLTVNIYTNNSKVKADAYIDWIETLPEVPEIAIGGGLRVKSVTNYDLNGGFIGKDVYTYGEDETGIGVILTPQYYQDLNFEKVIYKQGCTASDVAGCSAFLESAYVPAPGYTYIFHANSVFPTSQYSGSPVLYRQVTKYQLDINGNPNGKTVYKYDVYQDGATNNSHAIEDMTPFEYNSTGIYLISNTWMNGYQTGEDIYRSKGTGYELITSKKITYSILRPESQSVLKLKQWFRMSGCEQPYDTYEVNLFEAPITTGLMVPVTVTRNLLDNSNNVIGTTEELTYSPGVTIYPTQIKTRKSDGRDIIENINYPQTLSAPGNVYEKMVNRNILAPVIQDQELIDGSLVTLTKVNYNDWLGNANLLLPSFIEVQSGNSASEPRIRFNRFDIYGNILQQQKENAEYQAYIWDYNSLYPVAEIKNAAITDAAYTSFEADGSGGWTGINTNNAGTGPSLTGIRFYNLTASGISKSGLSSAKSYIVSYWSKNGAYSVTGSAAVKTGHTIVVGGANWTYYEHKVTGTATVTVSGTGAIDELRLYPANAQMMTYAYEPLKGMTSQCDAASHIKYFEYDGLCRLKLIRDEDGNILKTYEYHYKQ